MLSTTYAYTCRRWCRSMHVTSRAVQSFANLLKMRQGRIAPSPRKNQDSARPAVHTSQRYLPSAGRSFHKVSAAKMRRVALPPLNRMALNAKQEQWGIPVYSVQGDADGHGVPLATQQPHLPRAEAGDGRRMSVAM